MQALAQEAAAEIMERLREQSSDREQALLREFLAANRRSAKAVLALSDDLVMSNDIAEQLLDRADHVVIRDRAADQLATNHEASSEVVLSRGQLARLRCKPVLSQSGRAGSIVEITFGETTPRHHMTHVPPAEPLAGLAGHSAPWMEATKELEAHCRERSWVLLAGESGVGKVALTEAAHRRWHPLRRLAVLDLAGVAEADAWRVVNAELTESSGHPTSDLVLRHMDRLSPSATEALAAGLATVDRSPAGPWIVGTLHAPAVGENHLGALLQNFTESIPVPPLRHRIEDVRDLVPALVERHAPGRRIALAPEAMQTLLRGTWPGNVAELERALRSALGRRHSGQITIADLPESVHATSRRVLSEWESIERDAITRALIEARGDKIEAASRLGISRATIYRKIRAFGIMIGPMEPHEVAD
jgi:transcriptional regulator of acetoin/glycerol metabolism